MNKKYLFILIICFCFQWCAQGQIQSGTLDSTFGINGLVNTSFGFSEANAHATIVQPDGKILVAGTIYSNFNFDDFGLARYNADGNLDTSFHFGTPVVLDFSTYVDEGRAIALQSDGKIIVAGYVYDSLNFMIATARFESNGILDTTFNGTGMVISNVANPNMYSPISLAIQADGKIVVAGSIDIGISTSNYNFVLIRYNVNGSIDSTFDNDGIVTRDIYGFDDLCNSIALQTDGKIVIGGSTDNGSDISIVLARYNVNGSIDSSFNSDGIVTGINREGRAIKIQPDGKIILVGGYLFALRYLSNGNIDSTFGINGLFTFMPFPANGESVELQNDGKIVIAFTKKGGTLPPYDKDFGVTRLNTDGSIDSSFNTTGFVLTDVGNSNEFAKSLDIQPDGKIVVAVYEYANDGFRLARYHANSCNDSYDTIIVNVCNTYTAPDSVIHVTSGIKTAVIPNATGCDSIISINLSIDTIAPYSIIQSGSLLISNAINVTFQWVSCPSYTPISGATTNIYNVNSNGDYALIIQNNCVDTSDCINVSNVGIKETISSKQVQISPNPAHDKILFNSNLSFKSAKFKLVNLTGKTVLFKEHLSGNNFAIDISSFVNGIYFIELYDELVIYRFKVIKE